MVYIESSPVFLIIKNTVLIQHRSMYVCQCAKVRLYFPIWVLEFWKQMQNQFQQSAYFDYMLMHTAYMKT